MALSTNCHFCSESADFYKRLLTDVSSRGIQVIAVLPQPADSGRAYLAALGVPVPQVRQSALTAVDVTGTPTLLMVNAQGKITRAWVGKLTSDREEQVMAALR